MKFSLTNLAHLKENLAKLFSTKDASPKTLADYNREALIKESAAQFKKLIDKGLTIPVAHL